MYFKAARDAASSSLRLQASLAAERLRNMPLGMWVASAGSEIVIQALLVAADVVASSQLQAAISSLRQVR